MEQFLGKLHASMEILKTLHRSFTTSQTSKRHRHKTALTHQEIDEGLYVYQNELGFQSATTILENPYLLVEVFKQSCDLELPLSMEAMRLVREFLYLVNDPFRESEQTVHGFLNILNHKNAMQALDQMFETGFLDTFIPEFGKIKNRVQFDAYHIFPVGRHVLEAVAHLKSLSKEKNIFL